MVPKITGYPSEKYKNIEHLTVNFIDDSTNLIYFKDHSKIKKNTLVIITA